MPTSNLLKSELEEKYEKPSMSCHQIGTMKGELKERSLGSCCLCADTASADVQPAMGGGPGAGAVGLASGSSSC